MMNPFAAVYGFWMDIPSAMREPMKSAVVSFSFSIQNYAVALCSGYVQLADVLHQSVTSSGFIAYCESQWFIVLFGALSAWYRAQQANAAVRNTITLSDGSKAVVTAGPVLNAAHKAAGLTVAPA